MSALSQPGEAIEPDLAAAEEFLRRLDAKAKGFTFQTADDRPKNKNPTLAQVLHGSLADHAFQLARYSEIGAATFVTINETDGRGRKALNIVRVRALFIDLDGAPLDNHKRLKLGPHIIVTSSPGKWHVYWLVEGIGLEEAPGLQLRLAALTSGDTAVHDLPHVMRLPGFPHQKGAPFMVTAEYHEAPPIARDVFLAVLEAAEAEHGIVPSAVPPGKSRRPVLTIVPGLNSDELPEYLRRIPILKGAGIDKPADANAIADRCAQVGHMRATGGKLVEPLWFAAIGVLAFCEDGKRITHEWSKGDPDYRFEETQEKFDRKAALTGPTTCETFWGLEPSRCQGCRFRGNVTTPVQLGRERGGFPAPAVPTPPAGVVISGQVEGGQSDGAGPDDPSSTPREIDHTDIGNGRRLVKQFGDRLRYVHALKRWLIWDGTHWRIDDDLGVVRFAKETVNEMHRQASQMEFSKARDDFHKWAFASSTRERISAMIEMAKSEVEVILAPDKLDADPWLLGVQNGVIELRSGTFRPARQEDYITKRASVAYDPTATCPNFLAFIHKVTRDNKELIGYLQRVCGYVLTGDVSEEKIFVLHGGGGNGKTTYREVLRDLLGDYAISADAGLLTSKKEPGGATPEIARLQGRRFVSVNETAKDDELNEPRVKFITSNERIAGRSLYAEYVEFMPTHKAILSTNEKPIVKETNDGIWRRLQLVPFTVKIEKDEDIIDFRERVLRPELPAILNWALAGLADYLQHRLDPPEVVKAASDGYRSDMDIMSQWLAERCERDPRAPGTATAELHRDFVEFTGWRNMSKIAFARELSKKGFEPEKGSHGRRLIKGLRPNYFSHGFRAGSP